MKKTCIMLDEAQIERLREAARRKSVAEKRDIYWTDLLRESADKFLAAEADLARPGDR